ncbi:hypothetical protein FJ958_08890 [Mesorhizobium sp. B2-3-5]|nr:hypothetical protein FJ958_08890 [Mesorhizobium sp. B2-3-5]
MCFWRFGTSAATCAPALHGPPLSCRTSPPQVGRLAVLPAFANRPSRQIGRRARTTISPRWGGRTGGATERDFREM